MVELAGCGENAAAALRVRDKDGRTALHCAAWGGHTACLRLGLAACGVSALGERDDAGQNCADYAARSRADATAKLEATDFLNEHGVYADLSDQPSTGGSTGTAQASKDKAGGKVMLPGAASSKKFRVANARLKRWQRSVVRIHWPTFDTCRHLFWIHVRSNLDSCWGPRAERYVPVVAVAEVAPADAVGTYTHTPRPFA